MVVIDGSPSWAESLARLLRGELGVDARWYTPADLVDSELGGADVVVLGDGSGLEELRRLAKTARANNTRTRIMILSSTADIRVLRQGDDAGIEDILSREASADDFVQAVRCLLGGAPISPPAGRRRPDRGAPGARLTTAEARVLRHIAAGLSNDEIASGLGISTNTVRTHVQRVTVKLGAESRLHAVALARETGMLDSTAGTVVRR